MVDLFYYCHRNPYDHKHFYLSRLKNLFKLGKKGIILTTTNNVKQFKSNNFEKYLNCPNFLERSFLERLVVPLYLLFNRDANYSSVIVRRRSPFWLIFVRFFKKNMKIIWELEGFSEAEFEYSLVGEKLSFFKRICLPFYRFFVFKLLFNFNLKFSNKIFVVSNNFKDFLIKKHNIPKDKIEVFPTGVDTEEIYFDSILRKKERKKNNLEDKFVILYVGNLLKWQNIDFLVKFFSSLYEKRKDVFLFLISNDKLNLKRYEFQLLNHKLPRSSFNILSVNHKYLNKYLNMSDLGAILRENNLLNIVASPGKCGEYLAAGLHVLSTEYVGDYSRDIRKNNLGVIIDLQNKSKSIKQILSFINSKSWQNSSEKLKLQKWANKNYSEKSFIKKYLKNI